VKRRKLNPVVSPEITTWVAKAVIKDAGNRRQARKRRAPAARPGVADGIEQHGDVEAARQAGEVLGGV